ncbi:MAG: hypothetical protein R6V58_15745 [Planctomycetota bacterium]
MKRLLGILRHTSLQLGAAGLLVSLVLLIPARLVPVFRAWYPELGFGPNGVPLPWATRVVLAVPVPVWGLLAVLAFLGSLAAAYRSRRVVLSQNQHSVLTTVTMLVAGGLLLFFIVGLFLPLVAHPPLVPVWPREAARGVADQADSH